MGRGAVGHRVDMTEMNQDTARAEALQGVVERVTAWQETATDGTIHDELGKGLREAGITLTEEQQGRVVEAISNGEEVDVPALAAEGQGNGPA